MNSRRTVIIAAALALAAIAFFGTVYYLNTAQRRAYKNAELVEVFVVKKPIPKGLAGDAAISQDYVARGEMPLQFRPGSAIKDIDDIKNKVAINALSPGQVVVDGQFVDANVAQVTFAQRVPTGQVAVTISVDQVHGVAGLLMPGDKVNILVSQPESGNDKKTVMRVLYQNVNILAIGSKPAPQAGDAGAAAAKGGNSQQATGDSGLITFAVPLDAAQRIALAASGAGGGSALYLTLVAPDNAPVNPVPAPTASDNFFNSVPLTPYPDNA